MIRCGNTLSEKNIRKEHIATLKTAYSSRYLSRFIIKDAYDISDLNKVYPVLFFDTEHVESATIFVNTSIKYRKASLDTKRSALRALGLYFEFNSSTSVIIDDLIILYATSQSFYDALIRGTINDDSMDILWEARSILLANKIINYVEEYLVYSLEELEHLNIHGSNASAKQCYNRLKEYRVLGHLECQKRNLDKLRGQAKYQGESLKLVKREQEQSQKSQIKRFPPNKAIEMITKGCVVSHNPSIPFVDRFNVRNSLVFSMYLYGCARGSEPFHLYCEDIEISKNLDQLNVQLAHPRKAPIIFNGVEMTRAEYLAKAYKLKSRNELGGTFWAGWKELEELDSRTKSTSLIWIAPKEIKQFIIALHKLYIPIRAKRMKSSPFQHPYYFVAEDGSPLKDGAVAKMWKQTCKRIGLTGLAVDGQNRHGARHNIAMLLGELGIPSVVIKTVLHHKSILSQVQYQRVGVKDAQSKINQAFYEIKNGDMNGDKISNEYCYMNSDPEMFFTDVNNLAGVMF